MFRIFSSSPRTFVFILLPLQAYAAKRPFWNIAHGVNSIREIEPVLDRGANGIQFDVFYSNNGVPQSVGHRDSHDCPCNRSCGASQDIPAYFNKLRQLTHRWDRKFREEFSLIVVYNKLENLMDSKRKENAGRTLFGTFYKYYWKKGGHANILLLIPSTKDSPFFQSFRKYLSNIMVPTTIGYGVASSDESFQKIHSTYPALRIPKTHVWQSVGVSNCLNKSGQCICKEINKGIAWLRGAVDRRDGLFSYMAKVLAWTLDNKGAIRRALKFGVDGVMTDYPEQLDEVLQEPAFASTFQLANISHTPWKRYAGR